MAYFDSAKNRAKWQKELSALKAERDRRAANGFQVHNEMEQENSHRVRMNYAQLENEEYEEARKRKLEQQKEYEKSREYDYKDMQEQMYKQPEKSL